MQATTIAKLEQRKEKLVDLMTQKVVKHHQQSGFNYPTDAHIAMVHMELTKLLQSGTVTHADLTRIEQKLRHVVLYGTTSEMEKANATFDQFSIEPKRPPRVKRTETPVIPHTPPVPPPPQATTTTATNTTLPSLPAAATSPSSVVAGPLSQMSTTTATRRSGKTTSSEDPWCHILSKEIEIHESHQKQQQARAKQLQLLQKQALDEQIHKRQQVKTLVQEKAKVYAEQEAEQQRKWLEEQEMLENRRRDRIEKERLDRDTQLKETLNRRAKELDSRKKEDQLVAQQIKEDIQLEKQMEEAKRKKVKEEISKFLTYNQKQKALTASIFQEQIEFDRKNEEEYLRTLAAQERKRDLALQNMFTRQAQQASMAAALQKNFEEQLLVDEQRANVVQDQLREKEEVAERRRVEKVEKSKEKLRSQLGEQMKLKDQQRQREKEVAELVKRKLKEEVVVAEEKAKLEAQQRKEKDRKYRKSLEQQIIERANRYEPVMTETEFRLNRNFFQPNGPYSTIPTNASSTLAPTTTSNSQLKLTA